MKISLNYILFKKKKYEELKLSVDVLDKLENIKKSSDKPYKNSSKTTVVVNKKKIFNDDEEDIKRNTMSDFIPIKTFT